MLLPPSLQQPRRRLTSMGGSGLPILIILSALAISAAVFFLFSRKQIRERAEAKPSVAEAVPLQQPDTAPQTTAPAAPKASTPPAIASPAPKQPVAPPAASFGFARPQDLGKQLLRSLASGEFTTAGKLAAASDAAQADTAAAVFQKMMQELGVKMGREDQVEMLGMVENLTRISVPLLTPGSDTPLRLQLDLERDERMGWKIVRLKLPKELATALAVMPPTPSSPETPPQTPQAAIATAPGTAMSPSPSPSPAATATPPPGTAPATGAPIAGTPPAPAAAKAAVPPMKSLFVIDDSPDALTFASDFVRALLKHDFVVAKQYVDEKRVPAQRLAGLCIVFEEGRYELKPNKPLIVTVANPEVSWIIAQVQSESLQQSTEFGLELQRSGIGEPWLVVGLNLSEILGSFAVSASKLGVPYTPIVNNPKGGESLALYFEYDEADLHPRALKQLDIVAGLLKSDTTRKLNIAGHTDALGTEQYNLRLSQARAESVKKRLVELGVSADQVITTGLGKAQPLGPNLRPDGTDNPEGRSKNRRAEIFLDF